MGAQSSREPRLASALGDESDYFPEGGWATEHMNAYIPQGGWAEIQRAPLQAMTRFLRMPDEEVTMLQAPVCVESAADLKEGPLQSYMANTLQRLESACTDLRAKAEAQMKESEAVYDQAMALRRALELAAKNDELKEALEHATSGGDALAKMMAHLQLCRNHMANASRMLAQDSAGLEGGQVFVGRRVHSAPRNAQCADSLEELPAAQGFVRAVKRHLFALVVARLALLESAASLGSARHAALKACEGMAALLNVAKEALLLVDWLEMEKLMQELQGCTAQVAEIHRSLVTLQASSVPEVCGITEDEEGEVREDLEEAMVGPWQALAALSRTAAGAPDMPKSKIVIIARDLHAMQGDLQRAPQAPAPASLQELEEVLREQANRD